MFVLIDLRLHQLYHLPKVKWNIRFLHQYLFYLCLMPVFVSMCYFIFALSYFSPLLFFFFFYPLSYFVNTKKYSSNKKPWISYKMDFVYILDQYLHFLQGMIFYWIFFPVDWLMQIFPKHATRWYEVWNLVELKFTSTESHSDSCHFQSVGGS